MLLVIAALALSPTAQVNFQTAGTNTALKTTTASTKSESDVAQAARQWLSLVDQYKWKESWNATGQSFKSLNTADKWASVAGEVNRKWEPFCRGHCKVRNLFQRHPLDMKWSNSKPTSPADPTRSKSSLWSVKIHNGKSSVIGSNEPTPPRPNSCCSQGELGTAHLDMLPAICRYPARFRRRLQHVPE